MTPKYRIDLAKKVLEEKLHIDPRLMFEQPVGMRDQFHGDFIVNSVTYTVKVSTPVSVSPVKKRIIFDFDLREDVWKKTRTIKVITLWNRADFYILIGMINGEVYCSYLMPRRVLPKAHIRIPISGKTKYKPYAL